MNACGVRGPGSGVGSQKCGPRTGTLIAAALVFLLMGFSSVAWGQELTATEMVRRYDRLLRGDTNQWQIEMVVKTPRWERSYRMNSWMVGERKTLIRVLAPKKSEGQGFLKLEYSLWMYLPTVERTIMIPPSMMLQDFLGSDFSYDDLVKAGRAVDDYTHRLLREESVEGTKTWVIELTPKPEAPVVYGKLILWLRASDYIPLRQEFYDESGTLLKTMHFSGVRQFNDRAIPTRWHLVNEIKKGNSTEMTVLEAKFNLPLRDELFTQRTLERYP
ncbi:MAG TPA: outer membrane lipoprotein-sorting protein [Methylomirabilota bacterium]|nr:outer membrane lipoprotein-sorting protein [Methylomirabilota bacterium]